MSKKFTASKTLLRLMGEGELKRIDSENNINLKTEELLSQYSEKWKKRCYELSKSIDAIASNSNVKRILTEASGLNFKYRSDIAEEIRDQSGMLARIISDNTEIEADRMVYYKVHAEIKPSDVKERNTYINAHMRENIRNTQLIEGYIEFLRGIQENLKSYDYLIKNLMEIHKIHGLD